MSTSTDNWQPVETAPTDVLYTSEEFQYDYGHTVLLHTDAWGVVVGQYNPAGRVWVDPIDTGRYYRNITHWMPLPEPPAP